VPAGAQKTMAVKSDFSIRVAVGGQHGRRSPIWNIFSTRDEVYALHRTMGRIEKISFRSSRICRRAFADKHLPPIERWTRAETPTAGQMKAVAVLTIFFPEGHLSPDLPTTSKRVIWLDVQSLGAVRIVQVLFSHDTQANVLGLIEEAGQRLVFHHRLPNGEGGLSARGQTLGSKLTPSCSPAMARPKTSSFLSLISWEPHALCSLQFMFAPTNFVALTYRLPSTCWRCASPLPSSRYSIAE
jgi:hypothetical protein